MNKVRSLALALTGIAGGMLLGTPVAEATGSQPAVSCVKYGGAGTLAPQATGQVFTEGTSTGVALVCPFPGTPGTGNTNSPGYATHIYVNGYGNASTQTFSANACLTYANAGGSACGGGAGGTPGYSNFQYSLTTTGWNNFTSGSDAYVIVVGMPGPDSSGHYFVLNTLSYNEA